jgi:Leucine-rich repeat (LRR) protein
VSWNKLASLPTSLDDLQALTELDVSANKIAGWPRLPQGGSGLTKLSLSGNAIPEVGTRRSFFQSGPEKDL